MKNQLNILIITGLAIIVAGIGLNVNNGGHLPQSAVAAQPAKKQPKNTLTVTRDEYNGVPDLAKTDPYRFLQLVPVGKPAPDFSVKTANGETLRLSDFKGRKNVVLIFYQGSFCSVCGHQLANVQSHIQEFRNQEAEILAISADDMDHAETTLGERGIAFHVAPDPDKQIIDLYGVRDTAKNIAWPAAFIVDKKGVVRMSYADPDGHRLHSSDFLPALSKITGKPAPVLTYNE